MIQNKKKLMSNPILKLNQKTKKWSKNHFLFNSGLPSSARPGGKGPLKYSQKLNICKSYPLGCPAGILYTKYLSSATLGLTVSEVNGTIGFVTWTTRICVAVVFVFLQEPLYLSQRWSVSQSPCIVKDKRRLQQFALSCLKSSAGRGDKFQIH